MSSDEYEYRYSRKSYKKNERRCDSEQCASIADNTSVTIDNCCSPRSDVDVPPPCNCDLDPEGEVATILHKKCPAITLAQQQLQRLLDETDKVLCDNTRCCRSVYDFMCICREILKTQKNTFLSFLVILLSLVFTCGMILGAASCGTKFGRFNSPIIQCIDNYFISESPINNKEFRGLV